MRFPAVDAPWWVRSALRRPTWARIFVATLPISTTIKRQRGQVYGISDIEAADSRTATLDGGRIPFWRG